MSIVRMPREIEINPRVTETKTFHPVGYDAVNSSYASVSSSSPIANGYTDSNSTTYAQINLTTGSGAETYFYYTFDLSEIPEHATIKNVTCTAKIYISSTSSSYITTRRAQLCSGTTAKGSPSTVSNSTTAFTMTAGSWTREELQNAAIRLYAVRGTSSPTTSRYFRFYGATLTVEYEY